MLGLAIITSVVSLVSVALKSVASLSVFLTKFWLVAGEVCSMLVKIMYVYNYVLIHSNPVQNLTLSNCSQLF